MIRSVSDKILERSLSHVNEWAKFSGSAQFQLLQKFKVQALARNSKLLDLVTKIADPGHIHLVQCERLRTGSLRFPTALFRLYGIDCQSGLKIGPVWMNIA